MDDDCVIVEEFLRASAATDTVRTLPLITPDFVYCLQGAETVRGREDFGQFLRDNASVAAVDRVIDRIGRVGDAVAVERVDTYVFARGSITVPSASFLEVRDGLVAEWRDYQNLVDMYRFLDV